MTDIPLTRGLTATVDDADADMVTAHRWQAVSSNGLVYARRMVRVAEPGRRQAAQYMHTLLAGFLRTDHIDGNGLNNQRANLRPATFVQNNRNKRAHHVSASRFKGVAINRGRGLPWKAAIRAGRQTRHLGYFGDELSAAQAYDAAARECFGAFAALNFPQAGERPATKAIP